jgi:hypothetical protein
MPIQRVVGRLSIDKIACITGIQNACKQRPCFSPICFTSSCFNVPYQFTSFLNLPHAVFGLMPFGWLILIYLFFSYLNSILIYSISFTPTLSGTHVGCRTRPWCAWLITVNAHSNILSSVQVNTALGKIKVLTGYYSGIAATATVNADVLVWK